MGLLSLLANYHGLVITSTIARFSLGFLTLLGVFSLVQNRGYMKGGFPRRLTGLLSLATMCGVAPYLPVLMRIPHQGPFMTSATWFNNDLGIYLLTVKNITETGFGNLNLVHGTNFGHQASFDHPLAQTFFAAVAAFFDQEPFQLGIVLMATLMSTTLLAVFGLWTVLSGKLIENRMLVAMLPAVISPFALSISTNFFLAQVVGMLLLLALTGLLISASKLRKSTFAFAFSLCMIAAFLASAELTVLFLPLLFVISIFHARSERALRDFIFRMFYSIGFVLMFIALTAPLLASQTDVLARGVKSDIAGWKWNLLSPLMAVGGLPSYFGQTRPLGARQLDSLLLVGIVGGTLLALMKKRLRSAALPMFIFIGAIGLSVIKWGADGYQTWKVITSTFPFLIVFGMLLVSRISRNSLILPRLVIVGAAFIVGASIAWLDDLWKERPVPAYVTPDLVSIALSPEAVRQNDLNIKLAPFFETMAAASVTGKTSHLLSPSYVAPGGQEISANCTLVTLDMVNSLPNLGAIVAQRGTYVLVGTPKCD